MRQLDTAQIEALKLQGNSAEDWNNILVGANFSTLNIHNCHFGGCVEIEGEVVLRNSTISNYHICHGAKVISVTSLECRHYTTFGNGVEVYAVNDNEGRSVAIHTALTAQTAYIEAMYRHRKDLICALKSQTEEYAKLVGSTMGNIGRNSQILGAKFIREVNVGNNVTIDGASLLENGTLLDGAHIGVDVIATDFIAAENSTIDRGTTVGHCFVGENVVLSNNFSAHHSLFFAGSQLENGEASAIFAGPYTVSFHKSSLLIAGLFSFFNAGSGTNQSNHLFKSGAIHQSVHRRGCKFASNGYVMSPAAEGEFTLVMGRHTKHHDTQLFPFSYLLERGGISTLLPGYGLRSYGTVRDVTKWPQRDKRTVKRDNINYEEFNPLLAYKAIKAIETLNTLLEQQGDGEVLHYNNTQIKPAMAKRGIALYELYITAAIGQMLQDGEAKPTFGAWADVAGQFVACQYLETLLGNFTTTENLVAQLNDFAHNYTNHAHGWAMGALARRLGKTPTTEEVEKAVNDGKEALNTLRKMTDADRDSEFGLAMRVGYGVDSNEQQTIDADFSAVHGLDV